MPSVSLHLRKVELSLYLVIWALVFSVPFFASRNLEHINWHRLTNDWFHLVGYLIIFLVNVYLLVPQYLLRKRYAEYFVLVFVVILAITMGDMFIHAQFFNVHPLRPGLRPEGLPPNLRLPLRKPPLVEFFDNFTISLLVIGAGTTFKLFSSWLSEEKLRKDVEKEQLKTNLALLRHQVSPHFFMNTLNNIHALIDINTGDAKDAVVRLSTMMRYLLYDSTRGQIQLSKEIEFINSFISLMQLRFSDKVEIRVQVPAQIPDIMIPPMLFISFLENAFKHGISYQSKSFVFFDLEILDGFLHCKVKNSKHHLKETSPDEYSGLGLDNIRKSLKLLYDESYKLNISETENEFEVNLTIPL